MKSYIQQFSVRFKKGGNWFVEQIPFAKSFYGVVFCLAMVYSGALYAQDLNTGLVASFPFNGNANDESGNGNDGVVNGATPVNDRFGNANAAYEFSSADSNSISFPIVNNIPVGNSAYTIVAWVKPTQMGAKGIIGWGNYTNQSQVNAFRLDAIGIDNYWWGNDLLASENIAGNWHMVTATYDGTYRDLYIDGVNVAEDSPGSNNVPDASNLTIGLTWDREYFDGTLDDIRIYDRALTTSEIVSLYTENGYISFENVGLLATYPFNGNANDDTGNGFDGTVMGPVPGPDRFGIANSAYVFSDNMIQAPMFGGSSLTITAWIDPDFLGTNSANQKIINSRDQSVVDHLGDGNWQFELEDSKFLLGLWDSTGYTTLETTTSPVVVDQWQFLAGVYDNTTGNWSIYYNGNKLETKNLKIRVNQNPDYPVLIGSAFRDGGGDRFSGSIDDIRFYNRALSDAEIAALYTPATVSLAINSFTPTSGPVGTSVTINGGPFDIDTTNDAVKFGDITASINSATASEIVTSVPDGATTGPITVTVNGSSVTSSTDFTVTASISPTIESFDPIIGNAGTEVVITGTNFSTTPSENTVEFFDGIQATVTASSGTSITTSVPNGATTGPIIVTVNGNSVTSATDFTVSSLTIESFNPVSGSIGTEVVITGTNFSAVPADNIVKFNDIQATVTASSTTSITTAVPDGATTGPITVTVNGESATSTDNFEVVSSDLAITGFEPTSGTYGQFIRIDGNNFDPQPSNNYVFFGNYQTWVDDTYSNDTALYAAVPPGLNTGQVYISVITGVNTVTSTQQFTIIQSNSTNNLTVGSLSTSDEDVNGNGSVSVSIDNSGEVNSVYFWQKPLTKTIDLNNWTVNSASQSSGSSYSYSFTDTDPVGIKYFFEVVDNSGYVAISTVGKSYRKIAASNSFSGLTFGTTQEKYQLISVPYQLDNNSVLSVFSALGSYDKKQWRLYRYDPFSANNVEFDGSGNFTIDPGEGYWFIMRNSNTIRPGSGTAVQNVDENSPLSLILEPGWNLIGNPFNLYLSWTDILNYNGNPSNISSQLYVYNSGYDQTTSFSPYEGAFVNNSSSEEVINIPIAPVTSARNPSDDVRKDHETINLEQPHWELDFTLRQNDLHNSTCGIGMDPEATLTGKDLFDMASLPFPDGRPFLGLSFQGADGTRNLWKDFVPGNENFTWDCQVDRYVDNQPVMMEWDNNKISAHGRQLVLFDPATFRTVDMTQQNSFEIGARSKNLKIIYGSPAYVEQELDKEVPLLGNPYPNPTVGELTIPFSVPYSCGDTRVKMVAYDRTGRIVSQLTDRNYRPGMYEAHWNAEVPGVYYINFQEGDVVQSKIISVIK